MVNSRLSKIFFICICLFYFAGCTTSSFKVTRIWHSAHEMSVTPDRIFLECEKNERDGEVVYALIAYVLDDKKRVLSMVDFILMNERYCRENLVKGRKILSKGKLIYLAGRGGFKGIDLPEDSKHTFPAFGTFAGSKASMELFAIANDRGECLNPNANPGEPCLSFPFPLKDNPKAQ